MNSRQKGARGEREFAKYLREEYGVEARRGQQFSGSSDSPDVVCEWPWVHWEVKRVEGSKQIYDWVSQAARDCGVKFPFVAHRRNGKQWLIIAEADYLLPILYAYNDMLERRKCDAADAGKNMMD